MHGKRAYDRLAKVKALLPALFMAMATVSPHQVPINVAQWGQVLIVPVIQDIVVRAEFSNWQVEPSVRDTAPRTTSRDIKRHKASCYPDRGARDGQR
jgi:hypothetical protein